MTNERTLLVVGGASLLGRHICRLGRAYGARTISLGIESLEAIGEPWVVGVDWWSPEDVLQVRNVEALGRVHLVWALPRSQDVRERVSTHCRVLEKVASRATELTAICWIDWAVGASGFHQCAPVDPLAAMGRWANGARESVIRAGLVYELAHPDSVIRAGLAKLARAAGLNYAPPVYRAEFVAMAVLRAVFDPDLSGEIAEERFEKLGRSVMLQSR